MIIPFARSSPALRIFLRRAVVLDLPDNKSAAAAPIAVNASGAATSEVVVLLTPAEADSAANLSVDYRPPGSS